MDIRKVLLRLMYDGTISVLPVHFSLAPYMSKRFAEMLKVEIALRPEFSDGYRYVQLIPELADCVSAGGGLVISPIDMADTSSPIDKEKIRQLDMAGGLIGSVDMVSAAIDGMHEPPAICLSDDSPQIWIIPSLSADDLEWYLLRKLYPALKNLYNAVPYYPIAANILAQLWDRALAMQNTDGNDGKLSFISHGTDLLQPAADDKVLCSDQLERIWTVAGMPFSAIRTASGLTSAKIAEKFHIKIRTVESWCSKGKCPDYVRLMIAEKLGMISL